MALSPPPTTAITWPRKNGRAPSHTAHADTPPPLLASRSSPGTPSQRALAPVAITTVRARTSRPFDERSRKGRLEKSTSTMSSATTRVSKRMACFLNSSIISMPPIPSAKPG